jgi:DNA polymerase-4
MELPPPRDNQYLFLDMNAFFASCEQHLHPELRGKPVAVTPTLHDSGCVIAASYEAKRLGVTTGCRVGVAKQRIPNIVIRHAEPRSYVEIHNQLHAFLLQEVTPHPIRLSVDEFGIPLTPTEQYTPNAHALALFIKTRLEAIFSPALRCSIGIGPNMFLAKLGTEVQKPNGLVVIQLHTLESAYQTLKLRDIPGINWGMSNRLHAIGIRTPVEFYQAPRVTLHNAFGIMGNAWWYNLHGYKVDVHESPTKSMSHSHVIAPAYRTKAKARPVLYKLWLKVAERLREKQLATQAVMVVIRHNHTKWIHSLHVRPTQSAFEIFQAMAAAYDTDLPPNIQPTQIIVVAYHLAPHENLRLEFFPEDNNKLTDLFRSVDAINHHFGRWTIKPASLLPIGNSAPNRITFRVPDFEMDE